MECLKKLSHEIKRPYFTMYFGGSPLLPGGRRSETINSSTLLAWICFLVCFLWRKGSHGMSSSRSKKNSIWENVVVGSRLGTIRIFKEQVANPSKLDWVVVSNIFYFHPYLGKLPILTNMFQRGWNHQLVEQCLNFPGSEGSKPTQQPASHSFHQYKKTNTSLPWGWGEKANPSTTGSISSGLFFSVGLRRWNPTTLPETNIAHENPPFRLYFLGKVGILMGYVSFRKGNPCDFKLLDPTFSSNQPFGGHKRFRPGGAGKFQEMRIPTLHGQRDLLFHPKPWMCGFCFTEKVTTGTWKRPCLLEIREKKHLTKPAMFGRFQLRVFRGSRVFVLGVYDL